MTERPPAPIGQGRTEDGWDVCACGTRHYRCWDRPDARCLPCRLRASGEPVPWWWHETGQTATQARLEGVG